MVSLEEEMIQKDKEAAVLKANHKYEMLLNIELERIEKCKRTYENFHNFEAAVMRGRHSRILQKQCELKVMKNASKGDITDLKQNSSPLRTVGQYSTSSNKSYGASVVDQKRTNPQRPNHTDSASQRDRASNIRHAQYVNTVRTNDRPTSNSTSGQNYAQTVHMIQSSSIADKLKPPRTSSKEDTVKLPLLRSVSFPSKSATTTLSSDQRLRHFSYPEAHVVQSRDGRSTVSAKKKEITSHYCR